MHGFLLFARYGTKTVVGCRQCVKDEVLKNLGVNAVGGWWCIPWGIGTPLVILQNLLMLWTPASDSELSDALRRGGLDPDELRIDADGFTREQRSLIEAACYVLATAVWADGQEHPRERERAFTILEQFTGGQLKHAEAERWLARGKAYAGTLRDLPFDLRQTLMSMALDIAASDGSLAITEITMLHAVAERLGFAPGAVEALLDQLFGRASSRGSREESGGQRRRPQGSTASDFTRACTVLGVRAAATLIEVKQAWRREMFKYHPDRAGRDPLKQKELHNRAQEINWAYQTLQRHAASAAGMS